MGPLEAGILFVRAERIAQIWPSIVTAGWSDRLKGARKLEVYGQRDDPRIVALEAAIDFTAMIGMPAVEARVRFLTKRLKEQLKEVPGVVLKTNLEPELSGGVVKCIAGSAPTRDTYDRLWNRHRISIAMTPSGHPQGLRFSRTSTLRRRAGSCSPSGARIMKVLAGLVMGGLLMAQGVADLTKVFDEYLAAVKAKDFKRVVAVFQNSVKQQVLADFEWTASGRASSSRWPRWRLTPMSLPGSVHPPTRKCCCAWWQRRMCRRKFRGAEAAARRRNADVRRIRAGERSVENGTAELRRARASPGPRRPARLRWA